MLTVTAATGIASAWAIWLRMRSATPAADVASVSARSTANSSPPTRAATSMSRAPSCSTLASTCKT